MAFYSEIAPFYDDIFPVTNTQIQFLNEVLGDAHKSVLDIACGNGGHSVALAEKGYLVTAIDSDEEMLRSAREKADLYNVEIATVKCSMDEIGQHITGQFDGAICIGNSLVHLDTRDSVLSFLKQLKKCLKADGIGVLQIINYDKVLKHGMMSLPFIENKDKNIRFERRYTLEKEKILFHTDLEVKEKRFSNTISLVPLLREELEVLLCEAGFQIDKVYGAYDKSAYEADESMHYICIITQKSSKE